jgi:hypothetical protein
MLNRFLFKDSSGKKSLTATVFVWGSLVANTKLLFSGMVIAGITIPEFAGSEYAMVLAALGTVYVLRRNTPPNKEPTT